MVLLVGWFNWLSNICLLKFCTSAIRLVAVRLQKRTGAFGLLQRPSSLMLNRHELLVGWFLGWLVILFNWFGSFRWLSTLCLLAFCTSAIRLVVIRLQKRTGAFGLISKTFVAHGSLIKVLWHFVHPLSFGHLPPKGDIICLS